MEKRNGQQAGREDEHTEGRVLENAFYFAKAAGRYHDAVGCCQAAQAGDSQLPGDYQQTDPGENPVHGNEHYQWRGHQYLVGQWVHQLAQDRFNAVFPGQVAVGQVGQGAG